MENESERVNHPKYYEKKVDDQRDHPECIELLEVITEGLPGVLALDIGQLKYLYRFGSKAEGGLSRREKAIEDVNKILWYAKNAAQKWGFYDINYARHTVVRRTIARLVAEEFAFDKPLILKSYVRSVVYCAYDLSSGHDICQYVDAVEKLVKAIEETPEEVWN